MPSFRLTVSLLHALLALLLLLQAAGAAPMPGSDSGISGRTIDRDSGTPLPGTIVRVEGTTRGAIADSAGWFRIGGLAPGIYRIKATLIGYEDVRPAVVKLSLDHPGNLTIRLRRLLLPVRETTVLAPRQDTALLPRTSNSVTVLRTAPLADKMVALPELLSQQAGVQTKTLGGLGSYSTISIRGTSSEQVDFYLDNIPLNSAAATGLNLDSLPLSALEQIEIYRGNAPVALGGGAIGGVVHLKTRGEGNRWGGSASSGSFGARKASWFGAGNSGVLRYLTVGEVLRTNNDFPFLDDNGTEYNTADDTQSRRINDDVRSASLLSKLGYRAGDSGYVFDVMEHLVWREQGIPNISNNQTRDVRFGLLRNVLEAVAEHRGAQGIGVHQRWSVYYSHTREHLSDLAGELRRQDATNITTNYGGRATASSTIPGSQLVTLSLSAQREAFLPQDRLRPLSVYPRNSRTTLSAGIEDLIALRGLRLNLLPSATARRESSRFQGATNSFLGTGIPESVKTDSNFDVHFGLVFDPLPGWSLRANIGRYTRSPTFAELFGDRGAVLGNPQLRSEHGRLRDAGARLRTSSDWLVLEASCYDNRLDDLIQFIQNSQQTSRAMNIGHARIRGVETSANARIRRHFRIGGNYTYQEAKDGSRIPHQRGKRLPNRPSHEGAASGEILLHPVSLFYESAFQSGGFLDRANLRQIPSRRIHNVGLTFSGLPARMKTTLEVRNCTGNQVADVWGYPLPGRTYFLTIRL